MKVKRVFSEAITIQQLIDTDERHIMRLRKLDPNALYESSREGVVMGKPLTNAGKIKKFEAHANKMRNRLKEVQRAGSH